MSAMSSCGHKATKAYDRVVPIRDIGCDAAIFRFSRLPGKKPAYVRRHSSSGRRAATAFLRHDSLAVALALHVFRVRPSIRDEAVCVWHSHFRQRLRVKDSLSGYDVIDIKKISHDRIHLIGGEGLR